MCPCRTVRPRAAHGRGEPGPAGQLAGASEAADVADLGEHDQGGELAHAGQRGQRPGPRVGLGVLAQLAVDPVGQRRQARPVTARAVGHDLAGNRGQPRARPASRGRARTGSCRTGRSRNRLPPRGSGSAAGCPAGPARPGAAAARGAAAPQAGDPRLREQVRAQQLGQDRRAGPCRSSAGPRRSPCTAAGAPGAPRSRSPPAGRPASPSRTRPRTPPVSPGAGPRSAAASAPTRSPRSC